MSLQRFPLFCLWFNWFCRCLYSTILFVNINFYLFIKKKKNLTVGPLSSCGRQWSSRHLSTTCIKCLNVLVMLPSVLTFHLITRSIQSSMFHVWKRNWRLLQNAIIGLPPATKRWEPSKTVKERFLDLLGTHYSTLRTKLSFKSGRMLGFPNLPP
jgi:hypothetical protein